MVYDDSQIRNDVGEHFPGMTSYYIFLLRKVPGWSPGETPEIEALQEAQELISTDPMVRVGRLVFELHTWMVKKNFALKL